VAWGDFVKFQNAVFTTTLPPDYFNLLTQTSNQTHFLLRATSIGKTRLRTTFHALKDASGREIKLSTPVSGEQEVEINEPVTLEPSLLIFPHQGKYLYSYQVKAGGGTGHYVYSSDTSNVARINEAEGVVSAGGEPGRARVSVRDAYNPLHRAETPVIVAEPTKVGFSDFNRVEARVGDELRLAVVAWAEVDGGLKPFTDCRHLPFKYSLITGDGVFQLDGAAGSSSVIGYAEKGCAAVVLQAMKEGDAQLKVELEHVGEKLVQISVYSPLKVSGWS